MQAIRNARLRLIRLRSFILAVASWTCSSGFADYRDNLRLTFDLSSRLTRTTVTDTSSWTHFVGLDSHKVFTTPNGDFGTLLTQVYLMLPQDQPGDKRGTWVLHTRQTNFNLTALQAHGLPNVRVGHIEVPFGLEHPVNTNGTLHDYLHKKDLFWSGTVGGSGTPIGKVDWGITLNDEYERWEYEIGWFRGSGMHYRHRNNPGLVVGRVGTARDANFVFGASIFTGDLFTGVERNRYGVDAQYFLGTFGLSAELSVGEDTSTDGVDTDAFNTTLELSYRNYKESLYGYTQAILRTAEAAGSTADHYEAVALGFRWTPDNHWAFSSQLQQDVNAWGTAGKDCSWMTQLRYRF